MEEVRFYFLVSEVPFVKIYSDSGIAFRKLCYENYLFMERPITKDDRTLYIDSIRERMWVDVEVAKGVAANKNFFLPPPKT